MSMYLVVGFDIRARKMRGGGIRMPFYIPSPGLYRTEKEASFYADFHSRIGEVEYTYVKVEMGGFTNSFMSRNRKRKS